MSRPVERQPHQRQRRRIRRASAECIPEVFEGGQAKLVHHTVEPMTPARCPSPWPSHNPQHSPSSSPHAIDKAGIETVDVSIAAWLSWCRSPRGLWPRITWTYKVRYGALLFMARVLFERAYLRRADLQVGFAVDLTTRMPCIINEPLHPC